MSDLIDRQQAIDDIWTVSPLARLDREWIDRWLRQLPPAQPARPERIIHCKDCKYGILDCDFPHERYCDFKGNEWNNGNHFCGHAKRREVTT